MAPRVLASAVAVTFALLACSQLQSQPAPVPGVGVACDTGGSVPGNFKRCVVTVKASINAQGVCTVSTPDPDPVALSASKPAKIIWKMDDPQNFRFCPTQGDGAFLKDFDHDQQFSNGHATDQPNGDPDPAPSSQCKRHYSMDDSNTSATSGKSYGYMLQFHNRAGKIKCTLDPVIRNG